MLCAWLHLIEVCSHLWGYGLCRHNLCRCLQHCNLGQAVSFFNLSSCSTNTSSMPAVFLFFSVAMPFFYSSSVKGDTSEESPSLIGDNLGHLGFVDISLRLLTSSWCATWLAVTRQGGFEAVGSLEIFMIVCHAFWLLPVRSVDVIIFSHLLVSAVILLISSLPVSRAVLSKGLLMHCFLYASYRLFDSSDRPGCSGFYIPLVYVSSISHVWLQQTSRSSVE